MKKRILDWKFYHRSQLGRRGLAEIEKIFKRHTSNLFSNEINKYTCTLLSWQASLPCSVFSRTNKREMEEISSQTRYPVFKRLYSELKLHSVLSFDRQTNFQHGAFALWFHFSWIAFEKLSSWANKIFLFAMPVKCPLIHLSCTCFWFPKTGSHINNNTHLTSLAFLVCSVNYGSPFFPIDLWPAQKNRGL